MSFVRHVVCVFVLRTIRDNDYVKDFSSIAWVEFKFGIMMYRLPILSPNGYVTDGVHRGSRKWSDNAQRYFTRDIVAFE